MPQPHMPVPGHGSGLPLALSDLRLGDDGEPRVLDLDERLGFDRPRKIRDLIRQNSVELSGYGDLVEMREVTKRDLLRHEANSPRSGANSDDPARRGRGRPGRAFLLTHDQAMIVAVLSRAPHAPAVRRQLIDVFNAYRAARPHPTASSQEVETMWGMVEGMARLQDRLADRMRALEARSRPGRKADRPRRRRFVTDHGDYWAVRHFVDDCVRRVPGAKLVLSDLYAAWLRWQARSGQGRSLPVEAVRDLFALDTVTVGRGGQIDWRWTQRDLVYTGIQLKGSRRDGGVA